MSKKKNKKKKEKIIYYDDNSTIHDMSSVTRDGKKKEKAPTPYTEESKWKTYWNSVKKMFYPMCVVLLILCLLYFFLLLLGGNLF